MKCPKCNFISFDYNQVCPKCGKDLSGERDLMNFPSYKPMPLSLLGVLTGNGESASVDAPMEQSGASGVHGADTQELLISLDTLSDENQEPIQFEPEPSSTVPEAEIEKGTKEADEEFTISLDEFSDEDQDLIQFEPEPSLTSPELKIEEGAETTDEEFAISLDDGSDEGTEIVLFDTERETPTPEVEITGEVGFEPETILPEDMEPEKENLWESEAIASRMVDMQLDDAVEKEGVDPATGVEAPGEDKEKEPELFELELEPLELDAELEESDKKTS